MREVGLIIANCVDQEFHTTPETLCIGPWSLVGLRQGRAVFRQQPWSVFAAPLSSSPTRACTSS
jgi:hypothetical protein